MYLLKRKIYKIYLHFFFADLMQLSLDFPLLVSHFFLAASHAVVSLAAAGSGVAPVAGSGVTVGVAVGVSVVAPVHRNVISGNHLQRYPCQYATPRPPLDTSEQHPSMTTTKIMLELSPLFDILVGALLQYQHFFHSILKLKCSVGCLIYSRLRHFS